MCDFVFNFKFVPLKCVICVYAFRISKLFDISVQFRNAIFGWRKSLHICSLLFTDMNDCVTVSRWRRVSSELPCQTFINDSYKAEHVKNTHSGTQPPTVSLSSRRLSSSLPSYLPSVLHQPLSTLYKTLVTLYFYCA